MSDLEERKDEVEKYYDPISKCDKAVTILFWLIAVISLFIPYSNEVLENYWYDLLIAFFIVFVLAHFSVSQFLRLNLIPKAELARRKQLLSDSFGTSLTHDKTNLYYNNKFTPSLDRLAANVMENAFFSKEIASNMLLRNRTITGIYLALLIVIFVIRHDNLELIVWITQLIFSGEIVAKWLRLEMLRVRHEKVYDELYSIFLYGLGRSSDGAIASVLNSFADYECAKSSASTKLSTKIFHKLNPKLTDEWKNITDELQMGD
jgi:hypothetical protein